MSTVPEEEELPPGTVFADYAIVRLIGAGEVGAVYEAVHRADSQRVALKVLRLAVRNNEEIVARFEREARAVALLHHPGIVQPVDVGRHNGQPYLAMEYLEGESLGALMKREGRLPLGRALDIILPLMAAVRTVHAQNIVHRDLKPDNIFVTYPPQGGVRPKILDFGMAKMAEPGLQITAKDTAIGTPNFMSPEQMLSPRSVDPRSDQWALGVLLYFLLTGVKPFKGKDLGETLRNVLHVEPPPLRQLAPEVPEALSAAVARSMRKPPDERYPTVHDFGQAIMPFASDATQLLYASEFFMVSVWEQLGEVPPRLGVQAPTHASRRSRGSRPSVPSPSATSSSRPSIPSQTPLPTRSSLPPTTPAPVRGSTPPHAAAAPRPTPAPVPPPAADVPDDADDRTSVYRPTAGPGRGLKVIAVAVGAALVAVLALAIRMLT